MTPAKAGSRRSDHGRPGGRRRHDGVLLAIVHIAVLRGLVRMYVSDPPSRIEISLMMKALIDADSEALASGKPRLLDVDFISSHTHGFDELAADLRAAPWEAIERQSGQTRADLTTAARVYAEA